MRKLLLVLFLAPGLLRADVVYLKGGGRLSGRIVVENAETVVVDVGGGTIGVSREDVEEIERSRSSLDEYDERAAKLSPQDVEGWRGLGQWASAKGLSVQSDNAYKHVLAIAPDDPQARQALGYVKLDGRWMTEEESYRARGYVRYEGEWMTPAEVKLAQDTIAKEQAADEAARRASDAEYEASMKRLRDEEEKRAQQSQDFMGWNDPVYWGGWGYGVTTWPTTANSANRPARPTPR